MNKDTSKRATKRPQGFRKPDHWSSEPAPDPAAPASPVETTNAEDEEELSPTRYGDWVRNGIAVDF